MKWIEGWFFAYALLGLSAAGLVPILFPLILGQKGGAAEIGAVMAAFSLGGITAPVFGRLADASRLHRQLLGGGLLGTAVGTALFPFSISLLPRIGLALISGIGLAAASTVANLLITEVRPEGEWDNRIGWLQTFYGGGQVIGLVLAGWMGQAAPEKGLWLAGVASLAGVIPALLGTRRDSAFLVRRPLLSHPVHRSEWPACSPQHLYHHAGLKSLGRLLTKMESSFGLFLVAWLLSYSGSAAFFAFYPVLMRQAYGVMPETSSTGYALAAGVGLVLYAPAGRWSGVKGPLAVLRGALLLRLAAFLALAVLAGGWFTGNGWLAVTLFLLVVLAWSLLSVSGTALVASLSPGNQGEGIGAFNAVTAISGVVGAAAGGWAAGLWGYAAIPIIGVTGVAFGFLITMHRFQLHPDSPEEKEVSQ